MQHSYHLRQAQEADTPKIWEIIQQAKAQMYREKKQQWDESYPALLHITNDISKGYAYVLCDEKKIIAYGAICFDGEAAYDHIEGEWMSHAPFVVLHRLAVAEEMKRRGIAVIFMQEVEKLSIQKNIYSFKVDTNFDNLYMQKIFGKCGFTYCGEITYQKDSRLAYEKLL